jgi:hypothetical protein
VLLLFPHLGRPLHLPLLLFLPHDWEHHFQLPLFLLDWVFPLALLFFLPLGRPLHLPLLYLPHSWEHQSNLLFLLHELLFFLPPGR